MTAAECDVELLCSLLGDVSRDQVVRLLECSNGSVETAANRYFQSGGAVLQTLNPNATKRPAQTSANQPLPAKKQKTEHNLVAKHVPAVDGFPKALGEFVVVAFAITSGNGILKNGDRVTIKRGEVPTGPGKQTRGRGARVFSQPKKDNNIVRFLNGQSEIGRLPVADSKWLAPLLDHKWVTIQGTCVDAPPRTAVMDNVILQLQVSLTERAISAHVGHNPLDDVEDTRRAPLRGAMQSLLDRLGLVPVRSSPVLERTLGAMRARGDDGTKEEGTEEPKEGEEAKDAIDEGELMSLYRIAQCDRPDLKEVEPSPRVRSTLRSYQKQALGWMIGRETTAKGDEDKQANTLHPLWQEYKVEDGTSIYWSPFYGYLSLDFPSADSQQTRGGILADEMGLGKTVEILSLVASNMPDRDQQAGAQAVAGSQSALSNLMAGRGRSAEGFLQSSATLIVCPMSQVAQWRDEVGTHTDIDPSRVLVYYGTDRVRTTEALAGAYDVVLTTYQTLASDYGQQETNGQASPLHNVEWARVVLDEAHLIKNRMTQASKACAAVPAVCRWAVTGTPIQNRVGDFYSLVRFIRHEPWNSYSFWTNAIEKPFEVKDSQALSTLQSMLHPILLRRTKDMKDAHGNPLVALPPRLVEVDYVDFNEPERDFYDALFKRSRVKFSEYAAAGTVLNNYANILELLLRLRQACDHPMLTMRNRQQPQGQDQQAHTFSDIDKLLERYQEHMEALDSHSANEKQRHQPVHQQSQGSAGSLSFAMQVVEGLREGRIQEEECPICLDTIENLVVTPCLHMGCRECISKVVGQVKACPVCMGPMALDQIVDVQLAAPPTPPGAEDKPKENRPGLLPSSKLAHLIGGIKEAVGWAPGENWAVATKCIVFSQWTSMMDLIEAELDTYGIKFLRLDGSLSLGQRDNVLAQFKEDPGVAVLLMSLRTGGLGLNLTVATHVFLTDPWWNGAVEEQAIDRVHRIGQTKPVKIKKLIVRGSVEEKILLLQQKKKELAQDALSASDQERKAERLGDLKLLFGL